MDDKYQSNVYTDAGGSGKGKLWLIILGVVLLVCVSAGGVYYWQQNVAKKQKVELQSQIDNLKKQVADTEKKVKETEVTNVDESNELKNYTTKYEKLKFGYPSSLTVNEKNGSANGDSPAYDDVTLSNGNFRISIGTGGNGVGGACINCKVLSTKPITVLGGKYNLNFVQNPALGGDGVANIVLGSSPQDTFGTTIKSKNIKDSDGSTTLILINARYANGDEPIIKSVSQLQNDQNIKDFEQVLASIGY